MNLAVFDIDGTLTRLYRGEDVCFVGALESALGLTDVDRDWTRYRNVTDTGIVHDLCRARWGRPAADHEIGAFRSAYCDSFDALVTPTDGAEVEGARVFVGELRRSADWKVAIATGNFLRLAVQKLERGGLPCLDVPMATADDAPSRADLIRLAIDRSSTHYGVEAFDHVVSLGDGPWDLRTARELGIPFVAVGTRCGDAASGARMIVDYADREAVLASLRTAVCW
jgi:phosphoglycolate phosphatase-like HAD superfamily hydrolase